MRPHGNDSSECKTQTNTDLADSAAHPMAFLNSSGRGFSVNWAGCYVSPFFLSNFRQKSPKKYELEPDRC